MVAFDIAGVRLANAPDNKPPKKNALPIYAIVSSFVAVGSYARLIGSVAPTSVADAVPPFAARDINVAPFTNGNGIKLIGSIKLATKAGAKSLSLDSSLALR